MRASDGDVQVLIDALFERLEGATGPAAVNQLTHSLRLHITTKHDAGLALSGREQAVVDALGFIRNRRRGPGPVALVAVVLALGVAAYAVLRLLSL